MLSFADQFPRSIVVERAERFPIDADAAWAVVGDLKGEVLARDMVERVELSGEGIGSVRTLHLPGGMGAVVERIEAYDPVDRWYAYRVIDVGPANLTHHLGLIRVVPAGAGACVISWISMAQPVVGHEEEVRGLLAGNLDIVFATLKEHFEVP